MRGNFGGAFSGCSSSMTPSLVTFLIVFSSVAALDLSTGVAALNYTRHRKVGDLRLARIHQHLAKINKPAVKTIQSPDGDIIDCVHRHKQPALDHPLLKNHKIQSAPSERPRRSGEVEVRSYNTSSGERESWQLWHDHGRCPKGTIPIRRSSVDDVLRAKSLFHYGKKKRRMASVARSVDAPDVVSGNGHEVWFSLGV